MSKSCWLIGAGYMAAEYIKVLKEVNADITVIGRGEEKINAIKEKFDVNAVSGGIDSFLASNPQLPETAIVAVSIKELTPVTLKLLNLGVKDILIEKPVGLYQKDIDDLVTESKKLDANLWVAYNRRFYKSVDLLRERIKEDGGISSVNFEFTEWVHDIESYNYPTEVLNRFVLANSSHILDTVFHLAGKPGSIHIQLAGNDIPWHPSGSIFMGTGVTENNIPFSYNANWDAPGRWAIEVLTRKHRYYLKPLERLAVQKKASVQVNEVESDYSIDINFKPGLLNMVKAFFAKDNAILCTIEEHQKNFLFYEKIAGYTT
ncbi:MAG: Gfo/Idh/MocA family protein [Mucilaginibacter sp.]